MEQNKELPNIHDMEWIIKFMQGINMLASEVALLQSQVKMLVEIERERNGANGNRR